MNNPCGAKELSNPGPLYIGPKARAKEGKMPEDARRKPKRSRDDAENDLGTLDLRRKGRHAIKGIFPKRPQKKGRAQKDTHGGIV